MTLFRYIMRCIENLRKNITTQYLTENVIAALIAKQGRASKVKRLIKSGELLRLKNGFFVFGRDYRTGPIETFSIANLLYGPSYVSLESALSYYGMIPEFSPTVMSVTHTRVKRYETPIGAFVYRAVKRQAFASGVISSQSDRAHFLIATPEKAVLDKLYLDATEGDALTFLIESMRIEKQSLRAINTRELLSYAESYETRTFQHRVKKLVSQIQEIPNGKK